jgi:hypothetical protein
VRYAILFSGMSFRRHVNGLELCYRTLVDRFKLAPGNIHVLNYDKSLRAFDQPDVDLSRALWPGDGTPYRMRVTGEGSRSAFQAAIGEIRGKLAPEDQLLVNTTGHGGSHGGGSGPFMLTYPHWGHYKVADFCADLATLPTHRSLMVMMAQCFSGGFNRGVVEASRAKLTFIASSTGEKHTARADLDDSDWDSFERGWVEALAGHDVHGGALPENPDTNADQWVDAREAFDYANSLKRRNPAPQPELLAAQEGRVPDRYGVTV